MPTTGEDKIRKAKALWKVCNMLRSSRDFLASMNLQTAARCLDEEATDLAGLAGGEFNFLARQDDTILAGLPTPADIEFIAHH
jgi:hypothetical protein